MKVYLHIGTFKTGSTALQSSMSLNYSQLLKKGVYWGEYSALSNSHSNIAYGLLRNALKRENLFMHYEQHPRFKNLADNPEKVIEKIRNGADSNHCNTVIISNEAIFADAFRTLCGLQTVYDREVYDKVNRDMREELCGILKKYFDDIIIVCYLRRQDLFLEAQYNQFCKQPWYGSKPEFVSFEQFLDYKPLSLNYPDVLSDWESIFDTSTFIVRPYEKSQLNRDIIFDFFCSVLGLPDEEIERYRKVERKDANIRWDRSIVEFKKILGIEKKDLNLVLNEYAKGMRHIGDYAYFSIEERRKIIDNFEEGNQYIANHFLKQETLFLDPVDVPEYLGLSYEDFKEMTRYVFRTIIIGGGVKPYKIYNGAFAERRCAA